MSKGTNGFNHGVPKGAVRIGKTSGRGSGGGKKGGGACGLIAIALLAVPAALGYGLGLLTWWVSA